MEIIGIISPSYYFFKKHIRTGLSGSDLNRRWKKPNKVILKMTIINFQKDYLSYSLSQQISH